MSDKLFLGFGVVLLVLSVIIAISQEFLGAFICFLAGGLSIVMGIPIKDRSDTDR